MARLPCPPLLRARITQSLVQGGVLDRSTSPRAVTILLACIFAWSCIIHAIFARGFRRIYIPSPLCPPMSVLVRFFTNVRCLCALSFLMFSLALLPRLFVASRRVTPVRNQESSVAPPIAPHQDPTEHRNETVGTILVRMFWSLST